MLMTLYQTSPTVIRLTDTDFKDALDLSFLTMALIVLVTAAVTFLMVWLTMMADRRVFQRMLDMVEGEEWRRLREKGEK